MAQYIDKSALIAEIERRIKKYATIDVGNSSELDALYGAKCKALMEILSFLDTLEVKDVNTWHLQEKENIEDKQLLLKDLEWVDMETKECHCYNCELFDSKNNVCKCIDLCKRPKSTHKGFYVN